MKAYFYQLWLAWDQLWNAVFGGDAGETISSRAWRNRETEGGARLVAFINGLYFWQANHCRGAHDAYLKRKKAEVPGGQPAQL